MERPRFESPSHVDPDGDSTLARRRSRMSVGKIIFLGVLMCGLIGGGAFAQKLLFAIETPPQLSDYQARAVVKGRHLLLVFHGKDPGVREKQEHTFENPAVRKALDGKFIVVPMDAAMPKYKQHMLTYKVRRKPTIVAAAADGSILRTSAGKPVHRSGHVGPAALIKLLTDDDIGARDGREVRTSTRRLGGEPVSGTSAEAATGD